MLKKRLKAILYVLLAFAVFFISPENLLGQTGAPRTTTSLSTSQTQTPTTPPKTPGEKALSGEYTPISQPTLVTQAISIVFLSLMPFLVMLLTPFLKIVIVLSLLRGALGVQQAPPNQVINGVALMLSLFVMYPTGLQMYEAAMETMNTMPQAPESLISAESPTYIMEIAEGAREPMRQFLKRNASPRHEALFYRMAYKILPENYRATLQPTDFMIVVPAYITSQLKDAFEIGVLIYIPFFVIDIVTSNVLLAMGMMMLSPVTISMPLKLFLLVMLDGWTLLVEGLVNTFH